MSLCRKCEPGLTQACFDLVTDILLFFNLMAIEYHEAHRNTCTVFHKSRKGNEMFMVMGEDIFDAGSPITADIFIQDRDNSLHVTGWSFTKSAAGRLKQML